jgi:hypothetical protein
MNLRKAIQRRIHLKRENVDLLGDVNVALAANVGERGADSRVTSRQDVERKPSTGADRKETEADG